MREPNKKSHLKTRLPILLVVLVCGTAFLFGCDNNSDAIGKTKEQLARLRDDLVEYKNKTTQEIEELKKIEKTLKETKETVDETTQSVVETKEKVVKTKDAAKRKIRIIARRMPRSQEEANRIVIENGKGFFETMKEKMNSFVANLNKRRPDKKR